MPVVGKFGTKMRATLRIRTPSVPRASIIWLAHAVNVVRPAARRLHLDRARFAKKECAWKTRSESACLVSTFIGNGYELFTKQASGFIHERMLESTGVGIEGGCFEA